MTKKNKTIILFITAGALIVFWAALAITNTKYQTVNYWWQALMAAAAILYGIFGLLSAKHWGWLKSSLGQGVFFISLGLIMWGIGQAGWTYYLFKDPNIQAPPSHLLDILDVSAIPLWAYGIFKLSKATGARYGLRSTYAKVALAVFVVVMFAFSYYILVEVARGGSGYYQQPFWKSFFDLAYAFGDVLNITLVIGIFGLSWKYLGGLFKLPVIVMLLAFVLLYLSDFWFSYMDGKGLYYNGDWVDLLFITTVATFGLGLCLLDPSDIRRQVKSQHELSPDVILPQEFAPAQDLNGDQK